MARTRVFVVDDESDVLDAVLEVLRRCGEGYKAEGTTDSRTAIESMRAFKPHAVLIDLCLGQPPDGPELCRRIREDPLLNQVGIIAFSGLAPEEMECEALEAGADSYLAKTRVASPLLLSQLRAVLRPRAPEDAENARDLAVVDRDRRTVSVLGETFELTRVETEILAVVAGAHGRVVERQHLWSLIWTGGPERDHTLTVHVSAIRRKLERYGGLVETVRGGGYRLSVEDLQARAERQERDAT